jgi:hypothetical protein
MGVVSVRLNRDEDKILKQLSEHFHADKSTLIKKSLLELYENMKDVEMIERFEKKEKIKKVSFVTAAAVLAE